jgi:hypothetical protein
MTEPWRLDAEAIFAAHQPAENEDPDDDDEFCRACGEAWPCGAVWAADRVTEIRDRRARREKKTPAPSGAGGSNAERQTNAHF